MESINPSFDPYDGWPFEHAWRAEDADDRELLEKVFDQYHETLKGNRAARAYLARRALDDDDLIDAFRIGYADRTLGHALGDGRIPEAGAMRGYLQRIGVLRPSGHERFRGYLTFPVVDVNGRIVDIYGRKIRRARYGALEHVTLGCAQPVLFNASALSGACRVVLCKSPLEAATVRRMGHPDVVATLGLRALTDDEVETIVRSRIERLYVAFDATSAGVRTAELVAQALESVGVECLRVRFPAGMDANAFWCGGGDAAAFNALLRQALPIGTARALFGRKRRWH